MVPPEEGVPDYINDLLANLKDGQSPLMRKSAAQALGRLGDPRAFDALILALSDVDSEVQEAAEDALHTMGTYPSLPLVETMINGGEVVRGRIYRLLCDIKVLPVEQLTPLIKNPNVVIRKWGIDLLGARKDKRGIPLLKENTSDADPEVRKKVLEAIGAISDTDVGPVVVQLLGDPVASVREAAAAMAGRNPLKIYITPLIRLLGDHDVEIRLKALTALEDLRDPSITQAVITAMSESNQRVQAKAAQILGYIGSPEAIAALKGAVNSSNPQVKARAEDALRNAQARKNEAELLADLKSSTPSVREAACLKLSLLDGKDAVGPLTAALQDESHNVRLHAIDGLVRRNDLKSRPLILKMIQDPSTLVRKKVAAYCKTIGSEGAAVLIETVLGDNREIAIEAMIHLGKMGETKAIPALSKRSNDSDIEVRQQAIFALGKVGRAAIEALSALSSDMNPLIRIATVEALGMVGGSEVVRPILEIAETSEIKLQSHASTILVSFGPRVVDTLIAHLNDKTLAARKIVLEALGRIQNKRAIGPLSEKLKDENKEVREKAAEALGHFLDARVTTAMASVLNDPEPAVKIQAAWYLAKQMDPRAVDPLVGLLKNNDPKICQEASIALSCMRELPIPALKKCLGDKDPILRAAAAKLMGHLAGKSSIETLAGALKDPDENIREKAIRSVAEGGGREAINILRAALKDPSEKVRAAATEALGVVAGTEERTPNKPCPKCGKLLRLTNSEKKISFNPGTYWGCMIAGFILLPVLIGLPLIFYAWNLKMNSQITLTCVYCKEVVTMSWYA